MELKGNDIIYIKAFKTNHDLFDRSFIEVFGNRVKSLEPLKNYLFSCLWTLVVCRFYRKKTIVFGVFSNWMIPFIPKGTNIKLIVHNNIERRFSGLLKQRQSQLLLTSYGQRLVLNDSSFIGHPVHYNSSVINKNPRRAVLFTDDISTRNFVSSNITPNIVIKGAVGLDYIPDLNKELFASEYLILDRKFLLRTSSLVARGIGSHCKVLLTCELSCDMLNKSFETRKILCLDNWHKSEQFDLLDIVSISCLFKSRIVELIH